MATTMLIPQSTSEVKMAVNLQKYSIGSSLKVVGIVTNPILIEIPVVEDPDEAVDAHWQQAYTKLGDTEIPWQFEATNLWMTVDGSLGVFRINKPAGDNVGIEHKW